MYVFSEQYRKAGTFGVHSQQLPYFFVCLFVCLCALSVFALPILASRHLALFPPEQVHSAPLGPMSQVDFHLLNRFKVFRPIMSSFRP